MNWLVAVVAVTIAALIAYAVRVPVRRTRYGDEPPKVLSLRRLVIVAYPLALILATACASVHTVNSGHVGVVYEFGAIVDQVGEELQLTAPWQSIREANVQVQRNVFERLECFSKETQNVYVRATLNYQPEAARVPQLYREVGANYFNTLVESRVNQHFKDETVKYPALEIAPNREEIRAAIRDRLSRELGPYGIRVLDVNIDNIAFSPEFEASIERKQIATQDALRAEQLVQQRRFEAQQREEEAKGTARAIELEGEALRRYPEILQLRALDQLKNVQWGILPQGGLPLFQLPGLTGR